MERKKLQNRIDNTEGKEKIVALLDFSKYLRQHNVSKSNSLAKEVIISALKNDNHISANDRDRIFEPYFTTRSKEDREKGLFIVKLIICNKYQGKIEAINREQGVEFLIKLPTKEFTKKRSDTNAV